VEAVPEQQADLDQVKDILNEEVPEQSAQPAQQAERQGEEAAQQ
jgi:hypothetical protein